MTTAPASPSRAALPVVPPDNPGHGVDYRRFQDCIHCGLCNSACPTYETLGTETDGPRGRIYFMRAVTDGRLEADDAVRRHLDLCLNCRACETACPSGVRYHQILEPFRAGLAKAEGSHSSLPRLQRWVLANIFPYRRRNRLALGPARLLQRLHLDRLVSRLAPRSLRSMHAMLPRLKPHYGRLPEVLPAQGKRRSRVALFLGCVADAVYPETTVATARVLQANGCEVLIPRSQGCCGALDHHAGNERRTRSFVEANRKAFAGDADAVVVNAAGCGAMLKDEYPAEFAAKVRDISEFLWQLGPVAPKHPLPLRATYHDACHLRHAQQIYAEPRKLLGLIPELELLPLVESELCCGAAGSYNLTQPEMARLLGERKAQRILATGADAVFTGNVGCLMQVTRHLRMQRPDFWVAHPIDALWASYSEART